MSKRITISILILIMVFSITTFASVQKSIDEILYGELTKIETFGYIHVKVEGEHRSALPGILSSKELTDFAKLRYKNNFSGIEYREITAEQALLIHEEEKAKKTGSIWFRIWTVGEGFPIAYYIECKAGNYTNYDIWSYEVLGFCDEKEIEQIVRNEINRMIENFAIIFFKVRGEI